MDPRQPLLDLLTAYQPNSSDEEEQKMKTIQFVQDNKNCFERHHWEGHITGSAWIVDETKTKALLTHHKKLNRWLQLGGHADGSPTIVDVAYREAQEESGLKNIRILSPRIFDVDIHPIPARKNEPAHLHYDIRFLFEADSREPLVISDESNRLEWVKLGDLEKYSQEWSLLRMKEKSVLAFTK